MSTTAYEDPSLFDQAQQQVNSELQTQIDPLNQQIGQVQAGEQQAHDRLESMYGNLLPAVANAAGAVKSAYDSAMRSDASIYDAATRRLNALAQQRAQEAQTLSQKIGGPVAVGDFTESVTPSQQYLAAAAPADLMNLQATAQAGVQQAQAFAGQVFPLKRTEQEADSQRYFEGQIAQLRSNIATLVGSKSALTNERYTSMLKDKHEYDLQQQQLKLDRLKSDRDWRATLRSLHNEDQRIALAKAESRRADIATNLSKKDMTLKEKELNANIAHMSAQDKLAAQQMGLSNREFAEKVWEARQNAKVQTQGLVIEQQKNAMTMLDAYTTGGTKTITITQPTEVDKKTMLTNSNVYAVVDKQGRIGPKGETHYYLDRKISQPIQSGQQINDPNRLFQLLTGAGTPRAMAIQLIRAKLNVPKWSPGKKAK